ncbi:hypothetical protein [Sphingomonas sp.]|uniref:hypothetical protein n=1 Tax=Sphingomonas sp. TaxID=28214 RepID=UPI001B178A06|nr:hypothetical protein [Sphingomonas sp.]MBO9713486.1 hypothetical protein [Sphingomonas sp.]
MPVLSSQALVYLLVVGAVGGWLMTRGIKVRGAASWIVVTAPVTAVLFGLPTAAVFALAEAPATAAILGWAGPVRALVPAALAGAALPHLLAIRRRTAARRDLPAILVLKSLVGAAACSMPALVWIASAWLAG